MAVPTKPSSLTFKRVPLDDVLNYRWYFVIPIYEGCSHQLERLVVLGRCAATVAERVVIHDLILTLVYDIGFSSTAYIEACKITNVIARRLAGRSFMLTTSSSKLIANSPHLLLS